MTDRSTEFLFSTPEMTRVFSMSSQTRAMTRFEWALSCALERHGLAAAGSGAAVEKLLGTEFVDCSALERDALNSGNIAIPFVRQLTAQVEQHDENSARTIHLGATSQDVLDTALVLQMREAIGLLYADIDRLDRALAKHARQHAGTVLAGRTWLQPGPPTTLGLKLAGTLSALRRHRTRIKAAADRALVLQFGGAVGTLAALGNSGTEVSREVARRLELREPELPWHTQRDSLAEVGSTLALLVGSLSKFAKDVALLMQAEVGEGSEPTRDDRGGSSTMPQKHNPVACAAVLACAARMPGFAATLLGTMQQEHERGLGLWQAEWETIPELFRLTSAVLTRSIEIAEGLEVHADKMRANLDAGLGLPQAEAVSVALTKWLGKSEAHAIVRKAASKARERQEHLAGVLKMMPEVTAHLGSGEIDRLLEPVNYLGSARTFIDRVLNDGKGQGDGRE